MGQRRVNDDIGIVGGARSPVVARCDRPGQHIGDPNLVEQREDRRERFFLPRHGSISSRSGKASRTRASPRTSRCHAHSTWRLSYAG